MTLKNNRAPLLCYFKLCASFCSHWWIQTWVTVRQCPIWLKIDFLAVWPWNMTHDLKNTIGHLVYATSNSRASFRSHWWIQTWVTVRKRPIWLKIDDFFKPCDLEMWQLTLKNNRAPLLCYFKLCKSFRGHIQTGVTVRNRPIWIKTDVF